MLALARDYSKSELCHIYPPHKKQFIRGIREVRRAARGFAAEHTHNLMWTMNFHKCQLFKEKVQLWVKRGTQGIEVS